MEGSGSCWNDGENGKGSSETHFGLIDACVGRDVNEREVELFLEAECGGVVILLKLLNL